ncbi:hypothetical protein [Clostridium moutaii]|uniref:hypothetical protein n=1 Tax=Clostridium moutaii TaxID=3240932 RepID=UPI0035104879
MKHTEKYQTTIYKTAMLSTGDELLRAWNCILENQKEVDLELETINLAIKRLIEIQNYFKGVKKDE